MPTILLFEVLVELVELGGAGASAEGITAFAESLSDDMETTLVVSVVAAVVTFVNSTCG